MKYFVRFFNRTSSVNDEVRLKKRTKYFISFNFFSSEFVKLFNFYYVSGAGNKCF